MKSENIVKLKNLLNNTIEFLNTIDSVEKKEAFLVIREIMKQKEEEIIEII
ncbi:MAG: hypothetical protein Q7J54_02450 [Candidatus Woesearchaeota archaeon]|nr:hypothetical protein [Candidatus Woesearchaeota archaeon]